MRGDPFEATGTLENSPPVLFDGLVEVMDFISNQVRHGKTILALRMP